MHGSSSGGAQQGDDGDGRVRVGAAPVDEEADGHGRDEDADEALEVAHAEVLDREERQRVGVAEVLRAVVARDKLSTCHTTLFSHLGADFKDDGECDASCAHMRTIAPARAGMHTQAGRKVLVLAPGLAGQVLAGV